MLGISRNEKKRQDFDSKLLPMYFICIRVMMTSAQVVETSVTTTDNSPSQDYTHPDDQTTLLQPIKW